MKSVCTDCEIVFLTRGRAPLSILRCPVCHGRLGSYEEEKKQKEVWISSNFITVNLRCLVGGKC